MTREKWNFYEFSNWLVRQCEFLRSKEFIIELQKNDAPRSSIRLRAEGSNRIGELIVWDDGISSQAVADLKIGDFLYMRDGIILGCDWALQLKPFFVCTLGCEWEEV